MSPLATSVNTVLEFLARAISQEKEIKGIGKKEIHLFSDDIILCIESVMESTDKLTKQTTSARLQDIRWIYKDISIHISIHL